VAWKIDEAVGLNDTWRPIGDAISGSPITPSSQLPSENVRSPRTYTAQFTNVTIPISLPTGRVPTRPDPTRQTRSRTLNRADMFRHTVKSYMLMFDKNGAMHWIKNGTVSRSSSDETVSKLRGNGIVPKWYRDRKFSRSSRHDGDDDTPTLPPSNKLERPDQTRRMTSWTIGLSLFKYTTNSNFLVFDRNGVMRSNVTIHRSF